MANKNKNPSKSGRKTPARERTNKAAAASGESASPKEMGGDAAATDTFRIVAIGGSSGSLDSLERLLLALQPQTGMSFVVIQHLDPVHESLLVEILGRSSKMKVTQARDGDRMTPEHLYVIPPTDDLAISHGMLRLTRRDNIRGQQHLPIDAFFRDLAEDVGPRAVGIVLSGSGLDGSHGLLAIKAGGGLTFAQEPSSAKFDSMPRSAIATGEVDFVLTPERIGAELNRLSKRPLPPIESQDEAATHQTPLNAILRMVINVTGNDVSFYKPANLLRRLQRRMLLNHAASMADYARLLRGNDNEVRALYNDILINVTSFFRDGASVTAFSSLVFQELLKHRRETGPIRIWVPGCSTGEEAYSLAIALAEFAEQAGIQLPAQIFATDLRESAIARARMGIYPPAIANDVSAARLRRFFVKIDSGYQVIGSIREQCIFAQHNILADPPFSQLDLVSCRNVLIYFRPEYQMRAMSTFYYGLKPDGLLVLGRSESPGGSELFTAVDTRHRVYRKNPNARSGTGALFGGERPQLQTSHNPHRSQTRPDTADGLQKEADKLVLRSFAPPGAVVNDQFDVVQFRGRTSLYLEAPSGQATLNLIKMAREEFRLELQALLYDVRKRGERMRKERLWVRRNGDQVWFAVEAAPIDAFGEGKFFLVLFHEVPAPPPEIAAGSADRTEIERLRDELTSAKAQLQAIIEELEATNEEIKAANEEVLSSNEELQSMNEELETAKEELQSANEELTTVNEELQNRNTELGHVAADLGNLLASVNIPIVMLSRDLRIRRYTPSATKVLNLIQSDIGRPITDINPNLTIPDLENILFDSMETMSLREREISDKSGQRYLLRVQPFRTFQNQIDGVVMMLLDREEYAGGFGSSETARAYAREIIEALGRPAAILDGQQKIQAANGVFLKEFSLDGSAPEHMVHELGNVLANGDELRGRIQRMIEQDDNSAEIEVATPSDGAEPRRYVAKLSRISAGGSPPFILLEIARKTA